MDYFEIYKMIWEFHKRYIDKITDDDSFWETVIHEGSDICMRYGNCKFVRALVLAELDEFERLAKEMRADADRTV